MPGGSFIVVRKGAVKWVLPRREFYRSVILPTRGVGIIKATVAFRPFFVPRTGAVRHRIIFGRLFADPENRCHNLSLPWITFARRGRRRSQMAWGENERFKPNPGLIRFVFGFLAQLNLGRLGLGYCAVGKQRRDR